jgi:DHA2 family multidrug resistance protein
MGNNQSLIKINTAKSFGILLIVLGAFMCLLDTTIVDITIPHMMSSFRVSYDSIQWVIISYMISSAVAMPLAPWIAKKIGLKNTYILGIVIFTLMSAVCGIAPNLEIMIIARTLQGLGEGILVPTALSILYNIFPPDQRGKATGVFAIGAITGPALGPTLGGYINEQTHFFNGHKTHRNTAHRKLFRSV